MLINERSAVAGHPGLKILGYMAAATKSACADWVVQRIGRRRANSLACPQPAKAGLVPSQPAT